MDRTIFEQLGGTYTMQGDYLLPDLKLPPQVKRPIGVWGQRRLRYLERHRKVLYYNLLTSGKLSSHLADVQQQAQSLFLQLVKEYSEKEGIPEQLKAENPMEWVGKMNNISNRVTEIINNELIYTK